MYKKFFLRSYGPYKMGFFVCIIAPKLNVSFNICLISIIDFDFSNLGIHTFAPHI